MRERRIILQDDDVGLFKEKLKYLRISAIDWCKENDVRYNNFCYHFHKERGKISTKSKLYKLIMNCANDMRNKVGNKEDVYDQFKKSASILNSCDHDKSSIKKDKVLGLEIITCNKCKGKLKSIVG